MKEPNEIRLWLHSFHSLGGFCVQQNKPGGANGKSVTTFKFQIKAIWYCFRELLQFALIPYIFALSITPPKA